VDFLLVEPDFPIPKKSRNHKNFLPIGLLKIGAYLKRRRHAQRVQLVRGNLDVNFTPDEIYITSLFTYWSEEFWESVEFYRDRFPEAEIRVGGIYVSLMFDDPRFKETCDRYRVKPRKGIFKSAEKYKADYSLIKTNPGPLDCQILHASRGCPRRCSFCGTWKVEPEISFKKSVRRLICNNKIVFYDNNLLANPSIKNILEELAKTRWKGKSMVCESQSGFDGRILEKNPHLGKLLRKARFVNPKIAWDTKYGNHPRIEKQVQILEDAGFAHKDIGIFMMFNWEIPYTKMEKKRVKCWNWRVQVDDCRFRPLDQLFDNFNSRKSQTREDYYIHPKWTDRQVKEFRRNVRRHNICVRHGFSFHSKTLENKKVSKRKSMELRDMSKSRVKRALPDAWFPDEEHPCPR